MPKKTKRQKLAADKNRDVPTYSSGGSHVITSDATASHSAVSYSLSGFQAKKETVTVLSAEDQKAFSAMTKDISKTVVIALLIFAFQIVIFWKLRM